MFSNKKEKERKFKAFLIVFLCSFLALLLDKIDQEVFKFIAAFCAGFYGGANLLSKVVGVFKVKV